MWSCQNNAKPSLKAHQLSDNVKLQWNCRLAYAIALNEALSLLTDKLNYGVIDKGGPAHSADHRSFGWISKHTVKLFKRSVDRPAGTLYNKCIIIYSSVKCGFVTGCGTVVTMIWSLHRYWPQTPSTGIKWSHSVIWTQGERQKCWVPDIAVNKSYLLRSRDAHFKGWIQK